MTIKEKILTFLNSRGIKKAEFFESIGIAPSNFKGAAKLTELGGDKIVRILTAFPELSADWLMRDEGEMLRQVPNTPSSEPIHQDSIIDTPRQPIDLLVDKFLNTIQSQSEEIGHLKARIEELQRIGLQKTPSVYAPSPKPETVPT